MDDSSASKAVGEPQWSHVGYHHTTIPPEITFDSSHPQIKRDLLAMIAQYLESEGLSLSSATVQDEANVSLLHRSQHKDALKRMSTGILEGDWGLVSKLLHKHFSHKLAPHQGFLYAVCKQEYLELIDRQEFQKAFTFLTTHLKPLEKIGNASNRREFKELCYLLTCKSVNESEYFREWTGVVKSRERLVDVLKYTFQLEDMLHTNAHASDEDQSDDLTMMPQGRLVQLLHQAVAYQMEFSRYHPKTIPKLKSLSRDYECEVLPNQVKTTYAGHEANVKYTTFIGQDGEILASGSSDASIKLWPVECPGPSEGDGVGQLCPSPLRTLSGHNSRVWYMTANKAGNRLCSASGDGTVKMWDLRDVVDDFHRRQAETDDGLSGIRSSLLTSNPASAITTKNLCVLTLSSPNGGDLYSVNLHPSESHIVTSGYDQTVRLFDLNTGVLCKSFRGHTASVCDSKFNMYANLLVSGAKDGTIRLWDILSGLCVHTLKQTLGEVTSVSLGSDGYTLLSGSRNNSNRIWDLRMLSGPRQHLTVSSTSGSSTDMSSLQHAHSNTSAVSLAATANGSSLPHTLTSGSSVFNMNGTGGGRASVGPVRRFKGQQNTAKNIIRASFGPREAFVIGGSEDGLVYVWEAATGKLLEKLRGHGGVTYNAQWHEKQALLATSSHDATVKTWWWQDPYRGSA